MTKVTIAELVHRQGTMASNNSGAWRGIGLNTTVCRGNGLNGRVQLRPAAPPLRGGTTQGTVRQLRYLNEAKFSWDIDRK